MRRVAAIAEIVSYVSLILGLVLLIIALTVPAHAQRRPTAVLLNGLGMYQMDALTPLGPLAAKLRARGWRTVVDPHFAFRWLQEDPQLVVGHSLGGNAALHMAARLILEEKPPALVITIDPGRAPLMHQCTKGVRCLNLYNPWHPIGGQFVIGATNRRVTGILHSFMANSARVHSIVLREAEPIRVKYEHDRRCDPQLMPVPDGCP